MRALQVSTWSRCNGCSKKAFVLCSANVPRLFALVADGSQSFALEISASKTVLQKSVQQRSLANKWSSSLKKIQNQLAVKLHLNLEFIIQTLSDISMKVDSLRNSAHGFRANYQRKTYQTEKWILYNNVTKRDNERSKQRKKLRYLKDRKKWNKFLFNYIYEVFYKRGITSTLMDNFNK